MHPRSGSFKVATLQGAPVFVHWSFLAVGVLLAAISGFHPVAFLYYALAFALLVFLHELGHFAAARFHGLKVFSIEISGMGGICRIERPSAVRDIFLIYAAGMAVQVVLLLLAIAWIATQGSPQGLLGKCLVNTFVIGNVYMLVVSIIPATTHGGLPTDGRVLWQLLMHVCRGGPHPLPDPYAETRLFPPGTALLSVDGLAPAGFVSGIEILNDETSPMQFVVDVLKRHVGLDEQAAVDAMLAIHRHGGQLLAMDWARATAVATAIGEDARTHGHALVCRPVRVAGTEATETGAG